jgi:ketol-acid reductoisomerase
MENKDKNNEKLFFDGDLSLIKDKIVSIIGYGNQGRAQAYALRSNGINVIIGNIKDESWNRAIKDGYKVYSIEEASSKADIILLLVPDEIAPKVFYEKIEPKIKEKNHIVLDFASGYNITYGFIKPLPNSDVIMVAPRMIGEGILNLFKEGKGYPVLLGVEKDFSGKAWDYALAISKGIGAFLPGGVGVKSSFEEETLLDLFSEHIMAPMTLFSIKTAYEILTKEYGVSSEATLLELYASGEWIEIYKVIYEMGLFEQLVVHSRTSQYGQLTRGQKIITEEMKNMMRKAIQKILDGSFAKEWFLEQESNYPMFNRLWKNIRECDLAKDEDRLYRALKRR